MELVRTVMLNVIVLVFFATVLDLLLPDSSFRSYIKMAMGFFTVLILLQPVMDFVQNDYSNQVKQQLAQTEQAMMAEPVYAQSTDEQYSNMIDSYTAQAEEQYATQIARQTEALLVLGDYAVETVQCEFVQAEHASNQRKMMLHIQLKESEQTEISDIQTAISGYFGLDASQVQVEWTEEALVMHPDQNIR